ncbi:serine/threonine-protein kinase MPS1-like [Gastrolobium bilobum]|uniref:serine/threonine-protein kinase MPS1-like n=1 Tax=Gastrolobium bilobum TaxID=150636 RepID=UPI002AB2926B|nr:serine/threonine-protein kinase MPS1-like [Gastrolobium bilobum]
MDGKANLPINPPDSSPPDFLRHVQAALKRHRPLGTMQSNCIRPRRTLLPQRNVSNKSQGDTSLKESLALRNNTDSADSSISSESNIVMPSQNVDTQKKVHFSNIAPQGNSLYIFPLFNFLCFVYAYSKLVTVPHAEAHDVKATELDNLTSYMSSLGFAEMEWVESSQLEGSIGFNQDSKHQKIQDGGISSMLPKRTTVTQDHMQQFGNFLSQPATQSSVAGPSCATTTSVHSTSAPMLNSTTCYSHSHPDSGSRVAAEPLGELNVNPHPITERVRKSPNTSLKNPDRMSVDQATIAAQASDSSIDAELAFKESDQSKEQQGCILKETSNSCHEDKSNKGKEPADVANAQPQVPMPKTSSSDVKLESSNLEKREKATSSKGSSAAARKRSYDPDMFFKVNGKLYQRLGKIGSGGSSEVHKVISSDCRIYALKKIKLKGRDYTTAYGFCQEIEYLNRLKGKDNIIQLIDYEVTDKALLEEVMKGSFSNKDGRFKDDGYIYMVLEYGEIDLAHMLSQKWKELDGYNQTIDENWLRFYWQQILQAVNTIHEERIVHSDLKPANFLLVKGSLKLIDFGIAKAIMSDTTNIQRDSQVGTLSYMSPEAFMCNESDANGNIIKCGRPSDIWSLGCILYQMVYGRTPFSEYKTFWSKFKVITDPNHEIMYEPVSNPWLMDLMKRCLAWDRNQRWRIPQLLQHPFLVPPVPCHPSLSQDHSCKLLQLIAETCTDDPEASQLCFQLQRLLGDPLKLITPHSLNSRDQQRKLLSRISELSTQLQERLTNTGNK